MRYCSGENVRYYEGSGEDLGYLLREVANLADTFPGSPIHTITYMIDGEWVVGAYVHAN